jgi:hypothetical protein
LTWPSGNSGINIEKYIEIKYGEAYNGGNGGINNGSIIEAKI